MGENGISVKKVLFEIRGILGTNQDSCTRQKPCSLRRKRTTDVNPDSSKRQQPFSLSRKHFLGCLRRACEPLECLFSAQHSAYIGFHAASHSGPFVAGEIYGACTPRSRPNFGHGILVLAVWHAGLPCGRGFKVLSYNSPLTFWYRWFTEIKMSDISTSPGCSSPLSLHDAIVWLLAISV